jgi:hypothetical protein
LAQISSIGWADICPAGYQPAEYEILKYIESTGTEYIDTQVLNDNYNYRFVTRFKILDYQNQWTSIFGAYINEDHNIWRIVIGSDGDGYINTNTRSGNGDARYKYELNKIYSVEIEHLKAKINNESFTINNIQGQTNNNSIILFGGVQTTDKYSKICLYSFKIYNNNTLIRDFVPVRRLSNGEIGMYDTVTKTFFDNLGTGSFIAGPETYETIVANGGGCAVCPPNTYKDTVENVPCTPCPSTTFSKSGATSINDCGHVMHVGDKIYFLGPQKLTTPALHVRMPDGTIYYGSLYQQIE